MKIMARFNRFGSASSQKVTGQSEFSFTAYKLNQTTLYGVVMGRKLCDVFASQEEALAEANTMKPVAFGYLFGHDSDYIYPTVRAYTPGELQLSTNFDGCGCVTGTERNGAYASDYFDVTGNAGVSKAFNVQRCKLNSQGEPIVWQSRGFGGKTQVAIAFEKALVKRA